MKESTLQDGVEEEDMEGSTIEDEIGRGVNGRGKY
jgi:hypothetical protein